MVVPQKIKKIELPYDPEILTLSNISKRIDSRVSKGYLHTCVHSTTIHNSQEVKSNPSVHPQMTEYKRKCVIHTMKYYSALRSKEILSHATTRMNFEELC